VSDQALQMRKLKGAAAPKRVDEPSRRAKKVASVRAHHGHRQIDAGPLAGYLGYALRRAQVTAYADFIAALQDVAISPAEFGVLTIINHNPGLRPADVCKVLGILKPNFVAVLASLERRNLVERHHSQNDRRTLALHLTAAGTALLRRACTLQSEHEARMAEKLGARGRAQLLQLLHKLADAF
jgi:DNA-binding MarR family transcriptional regulator